ncbi:hypothetical protein EJ06DRAFT_378111 [Trichodelitschia bisporula]|uniref:Uncharacterized protein n=1 Tax=Trichodelitschia bisporula TaxID=703511 RepID=A0A6G1HYJ1_9PEZI|nr:hypothetical protein EJ06DRAFT_378111 [Trichodelitschia bisporula]
MHQVGWKGRRGTALRARRERRTLPPPPTGVWMRELGREEGIARGPALELRCGALLALGSGVVWSGVGERVHGVEGRRCCDLPVTRDWGLVRCVEPGRPFGPAELGLPPRLFLRETGHAHARGSGGVQALAQQQMRGEVLNRVRCGRGSVWLCGGGPRSLCWEQSISDAGGDNIGSPVTAYQSCVCGQQIGIWFSGRGAFIVR